MNRRNLAVWALYDFANSIVMIVFFLYYSQWLVVECGISDFVYNLIYVASSALLLLSAPLLARYSDKTGGRLRYLGWCTFLATVFFIGTACIAAYLPSFPISSMITFAVANYLYLFCFVFYNPLIFDIAPPDKQGIASGAGLMANWLGQICGLLIALPLKSDTFTFLGASARTHALLPATLLFSILSLPLFFLFREQRTRISLPFSPKIEATELLRATSALLACGPLALFLLGYFLFNDAILTVANNFPLYLEQVFAVPDTTKSLILVTILGMSAVGSIGFGWIADRLGAHRTLVALLVAWIIILPILAFTETLTLFWILAAFVGLLYGGVWSVTRTRMAELTPPNQENFAFSFYTLFERFATFVGPLSWGLVVSGLHQLGPNRYRLALLLMTVFVLLGLWSIRATRTAGESSHR